MIYSEGEQNKTDQPVPNVYKFYLPESKRLICALFLFAMATLTRSTGLLLAIFFAYYMINKTIHRAT